MAGSRTALHAPIEWAQRDNLLYLTICVDDCKAPHIEIKEDKLIFRGRGGHPETDYESSIEFYKPVDAEKAKRIPSDRHIQYMIPKKEKGPFWPRLVTSDKRIPWIKVDFNKWKDEDDDSGDEAMKWNMNDFGGGGMFGGSDKNDFGDMDESDEDELPDLESDEEDKEKPSEEPVADIAATKAKGEAAEPMEEAATVATGDKKPEESEDSSADKPAAGNAV